MNGPKMDAIYTAENITKTFGHGNHQVTAAKDVSFELIEGQTTTIVGESGSGKSTMARMVLGLMPVTSGKLTFQGKDVTHLKGRDRAQYWRDVQAVFQDPFSAFNQFFTVRKLLARSMALPTARWARSAWRSHSATSAWISACSIAIRTSCPAASASGS